MTALSTVLTPQPIEAVAAADVEIRSAPPTARGGARRVLDLRLAAGGSSSAGARRLTPAAVHDMAERLRQSYIDYIGERGRESGDREWWVGRVAERNPFVSQAFFALVRVAATVEAVEREPGAWTVVVDDRATAESLAATLTQRGHRVRRDRRRAARLVEGMRTGVEFLLRRLYFTAKHAARIAIARSVHRAPSQPALSAAVASGRPLAVVQTWIDQRCFDATTRRITESIDFAGVKRALAERGFAVAGMPMILRTVPYGRVVRTLVRGREPVLIPDAYVSFGDLCRVLWRSLVSRPPRRRYPDLHGVVCQPLFARDDQRDWLHHRRWEVELLDATVRGWRRAGLRIDRLIHTFESHTWERVVGLALAREFPGAARIGYMAPALSRFRLNEFMTAYEWAEGPVPDRVVVFGPPAARALRASGCPAARIVVGAAPRYRHLLAGEERLEGSEEAAVVVAFSIDALESADLLRRVVLALGECRGMDVWLKFHPTMPGARVRSAAGDPSLPANFRERDEPPGELLGKAAVMVYASSGVALEALARGVVPVHVRIETRLDQDPLEVWPDLREVADDAASLRQAVLRHVGRNPRDREARRAAGRAALAGYLGDDERAFVEAFGT